MSVKREQGLLPCLAEPKEEMVRQELPLPKKPYNVITYEMRVRLINLASQEGYSISRAARELGIKTSTGKFIVKSFRDQGKVMKKSTDVECELKLPANGAKLPSRSKMSKKRKIPEIKSEQCNQQPEPFCPPYYPYFYDQYYPPLPEVMLQNMYYPPYFLLPEAGPYFPEQETIKSEDILLKKEESSTD